MKLGILRTGGRVKALIVGANASWYCAELGRAFARLDCIGVAPGAVGRDLMQDLEVVVAFGASCRQLLSAGSDAL